LAAAWGTPSVVCGDDDAFLSLLAPYHPCADRSPLWSKIARSLPSSRKPIDLLVAGIVPGINRQPLKKLAADETALLQLLYR
jgi:hypothetical protein